MTDFEQIPRETWAANHDAAVGAMVGKSRQAASAARVRLGMPPSPEKRGGDRKSLAKRDPETPTVFTINCRHGQKVGWIKAAQADGRRPEEWAAAMLDEAAMD